MNTILKTKAGIFKFKIQVDDFDNYFVDIFRLTDKKSKTIKITEKTLNEIERRQNVDTLHEYLLINFAFQF